MMKKMKSTIHNTQYVILITLILAWLILPQTGRAAAPVANDQTLVTNEDTSINITLAASDGDGDSLTYSIVTSASHGSFTTNNPPNLTYKPTANYNGADSFTFKVNDGTSDSNIATISLTINPVNDPPSVYYIPNPIIFAIKPEETSVTKTYIIPVIDPDKDILTYSVTGLPSGASLNSQTGQITWTVTHQDIGSYPNITFTASDGQLQSSKTVTLVVREAVTYYCDPNGSTQTGDGSNGNPWGTLQSVLEAVKFNGTIIKSGDIVRLKTGFHGKFDMLNNVPTGTVKQNTDYITIEADTGAVADVSFVWVYNCNYWRFKGLRISPGFSNQVSIEEKANTGGIIVRDISGSTNNHITIEDCNIFTVEDISSWDANDWHELAYNGIYATYPTNLTIHGNFIHNVATGITSYASTNLLIEQNTIDGFGADGIQVTLTNSIIQDNIITNVYDDNYEGTHSDCIQINQVLPYSALANHDIIIRRNYCCACTDPSRSMASIGQIPGKTVGYLQGFFLDGVSNGLIENNVIIPTQYGYGISLNSYANNVRIVNNTVVGCYRFTLSTPDIYLPNLAGKWGARDVIVRNNIAHTFPPDSNNPPQPAPFIYENVDVDNNFDIVNIYDRYVEFVDYINGNVHLAANSHFIDAGSGSDAPNEDLERNSRPQGQGYDVGAYEYGASTFLYGDVNNDKEISAYDAALAARLAVGLDELTADKLKVADVNGDSEVTAYDAALIAQRAVGLIDKFPVE